jgi:sec-independent protein translocase protein TatA
MPGIPELIIVLVIVLLVLGPKRLPSLGRQLGGGMREFKDGIQGRGKDDASADPPELTPAATARDDERSTRTGG